MLDCWVPDRNSDLVSASFIPGRFTVKFMQLIAGCGVKLQIQNMALLQLGLSYLTVI